MLAQTDLKLVPAFALTQLEHLIPNHASRCMPLPFMANTTASLARGQCGILWDWCKTCMGDGDITYVLQVTQIHLVSASHRSWFYVGCDCVDQSTTDQIGLPHVPPPSLLLRRLLCRQSTPAIRTPACRYDGSGLVCFAKVIIRPASSRLYNPFVK